MTSNIILSKIPNYLVVADVLHSGSESTDMFPKRREQFVTVGKWRQQKRISVRQYLRFRGADKLYPSKKGISMTVDNLIDLMYQKERITDALKLVEDEDGEVSFRHHIGRNIFVTVDTGREYVNIRQWCLPEGAEQVVPTRKGICLLTEEWNALLEHATEVEKLVPEVKGGVPCAYRDDHANQVGLLSCSHCNPNTYQDWESLLK
jgi:hypothetical protein